MKKKFNVLISIVILSAVAVGGYYFLYGKAKNIDDSKFKGILVETDTVKKMPVRRIVSVTGILEAQHSVQIVSEVPGKVAEVKFSQGERVEKGQVLVVIDRSTYEAALVEANAKVTLARANYNRAKSLYDKGFGPQSSVEKTNGELEVALSEQRRTQINLDKTVIRAPFSGHVGLKKISVGMFASNNQELLTILNKDSLYVDFSIPESYVASVGIGKEIAVSMTGAGLENISANVVAIDPKADQSTHSIKVRAMIKNQEDKLRPGQFAKVTLELDKDLQALVVPTVAIETEGNKKYVFIVLEGRAFKVDVNTGIQEGQYTQVSSELDTVFKEGTVIVTSGQLKLQDGYPVRIAESNPQSGMSSTDASADANDNSNPAANANPDASAGAGSSSSANASADSSDSAKSNANTNSDINANAASSDSAAQAENKVADDSSTAQSKAADYSNTTPSKAADDQVVDSSNATQGEGNSSATKTTLSVANGNSAAQVSQKSQAPQADSEAESKAPQVEDKAEIKFESKTEERKGEDNKSGPRTEDKIDKVDKVDENRRDNASQPNVVKQSGGSTASSI